MSQFSDKCKKLLQENGSNVYQLSLSASLERTTLQRMITGKRLPNIDFVKSFCRALRISQFEEIELLKLYKIETMGETAYHNEEIILQFLQRLKALEKNNYQECIASVDYESIELSSHISRQRHDTRLMLHFILAKEFTYQEDGTVYTNIPVTYSSFIPALETIYQRKKKRISVIHLVPFQMNSSSTGENLEALTHVLPFFLSDILDYQVFYHYSRITKNDQMHQLFPYYVITTQHVLLLSDDLNSGILLSSPDTVEQYRLEFLHVVQLSKPLFHRAQTLRDAFNLFNTKKDVPLHEFCALHFQPCYAKLHNRKGFITSAESLLPPELHTLAKAFWDSTEEEMENPYHTIFSKEGLDNFCQTGKYYGQVATFFSPLTVSERINALKYYLNLEFFEEDIMLKNMPLSIPQNLFFELHGIQLLQIIRIENVNTIDFMKIEESSICEAFYQFFQSLPHSDYIYSPEETRNIILQKIKELEAIEDGSTPPRKMQ